MLGKLPDGVLQLLSGGSPACSTKVGGVATDGTCTINYMTLGKHSVTARYEPDDSDIKAPFETSAATISPYSTSTSESIEKVGSIYQLYENPYYLYSATYTVTADTVDQYGYGVAASDGSWEFQLSGPADDGNTFETTITAPPGQTSCEITIQAMLDYTSQSSSVSSSDCSGGSQHRRCRRRARKQRAWVVRHDGLHVDLGGLLGVHERRSGHRLRRAVSVNGRADCLAVQSTEPPSDRVIRKAPGTGSRRRRFLR